MTSGITITAAGGTTGSNDDIRSMRVKAPVRQLVIVVASGAIAFAAAACASTDASPDDVQDIHSGKSKPTATSAPR